MFSEIIIGQVDIQMIDSPFNLFVDKGAMNLAQELSESLRIYEKAGYYTWEEDPMYSKRERELLQQFMQQHGGLPEGNAALDDDLY